MGTSSLPVLLAILSGFITIQTFGPLQFRSRFQEWDRVVLDSTLLGAVLFLLVRSWILPWLDYFDLADACRAWSHRALPIPFGASSLGAVVLGLGSALVLDFLLRLAKLRDRAIRRVIGHNGGDLLSLLVGAFGGQRLVSISLRDGKAYVGYLARTPGITKERMVTLIPVLSGYRDRETRELYFTTDYVAAYERMEEDLRRSPRVVSTIVPRGFELVISLHDVLIASLFDPDLYERYFRGRAQRERRASHPSH